MGVIWTRQPQAPVIPVASVCNIIAPNALNVTDTGSTASVNTFGLARETSGTTYIANPPSRRLRATQFTYIFAGVLPAAVNSNSTGLIGHISSGAYTIAPRFDSSLVLACTIFNGTTITLANFGTGWGGKSVVIAYSWISGDYVKARILDVATGVVTSATSAATFTGTLNHYQTGFLARTGARYNGSQTQQTNLLAILNEASADSTLDSLVRNPWQIFQPLDDITDWFTGFSAGGTPAASLILPRRASRFSHMIGR